MAGKHACSGNHQREAKSRVSKHLQVREVRDLVTRSSRERQKQIEISIDSPAFSSSPSPPKKDGDKRLRQDPPTGGGGVLLVADERVERRERKSSLSYHK